MVVTRLRNGLLLVIVLFATQATVERAAAVPPECASMFPPVWERIDLPVAAGQESRTWMWGESPSGFASGLEQYADSVDGWRAVYYFDKARMESRSSSQCYGQPEIRVSGMSPTVCWRMR